MIYFKIQLITVFFCKINVKKTVSLFTYNIKKIYTLCEGKVNI